MGDDTRRSAPVPWPVAAAVGVVVAIGVGWWWTRDAPPRTPPDPARAPAEGPATALPEPPVARRGTGAPEEVLTVDAGDTLTISHDALPTDEPLVVGLRLGEPSANTEPRPVRVLSMAEGDDRSLELSGRLDETRATAQIEIDPHWLAPGRYLLEVKTTGRTHFPLRRYVIEVR